MITQDYDPFGEEIDYSLLPLLLCLFVLKKDNEVTRGGALFSKSPSRQLLTFFYEIIVMA